MIIQTIYECKVLKLRVKEVANFISDLKTLNIELYAEYKIKTLKTTLYGLNISKINTRRQLWCSIIVIIVSIFIFFTRLVNKNTLSYTCVQDNLTYFITKLFGHGCQKFR